MKRVSLLITVTLARLACSAATAAPPASAPATAPATQPTTDVRTFWVTPAAPPASPMAYRFDFPRDEQYDGNGVSSFLQALTMVPNDEFLMELDTIDETTSDDAYVKAVRASAKVAWLDTQVPSTLMTAVRYRTTSFDWPVRDQGINTLLPYLNHTRVLANYLHYKARLATATGDVKQSIELVRAMLILADQTDDGETFFVNNLVSVGMGQLAVEEIQRLMNRPDAPNLYWALRRLPTPFGNLHAAAHSEETVMECTFPELREARSGHELSAAAWKKVQEGTDDITRKFSPASTSRSVEKANDETDDRFSASRLVAARADYTRRYHRSGTEVDRLDPAQVISVYEYFSYRDALDSLLKWTDLPYPQALPNVAAEGERLQQLKRSQPDNPFARVGLLSLSLTGPVVANARLDRAFAACATVEAIRGYAASHDGRMPVALADLTELPAPQNPATGRSFDYTVRDGVAVLSDADSLAGRPLRYEIRIRKAPLPTTAGH